MKETSFNRYTKTLDVEAIRSWDLGLSVYEWSPGECVAFHTEKRMSTWKSWWVALLVGAVVFLLLSLEPQAKKMGSRTSRCCHRGHLPATFTWAESKHRI